MSNNKEPARYKVIFSGCNHEAIRTEKELANPIEQQFNSAKLHRDVYACPGCAKGERGFSHNTVLHSIHTAMKLTPLDNRRLSF
jgi:hypothetical protein